jgi:hypothetical protein
MTVTREMISAAHREAMTNGDVILSAELLTRIYEAMAARKPRISWACPVCAASVDVREVCDCKAADMPFGRCCKADK